MERVFGVHISDLFVCIYYIEHLICHVISEPDADCYTGIIIFLIYKYYKVVVTIIYNISLFLILWAIY